MLNPAEPYSYILLGEPRVVHAHLYKSQIIMKIISYARSMYMHVHFVYIHVNTKTILLDCTCCIYMYMYTLTSAAHVQCIYTTINCYDKNTRPSNIYSQFSSFVPP